MRISRFKIGNTEFIAREVSEWRGMYRVEEYISFDGERVRGGSLRKHSIAGIFTNNEYIGEAEGDEWEMAMKKARAIELAEK